MNGNREEARDEIELGDLENDAFLPHETISNAKSASNSILNRWIPSRIRVFLENVSKVKVRPRKFIGSEEMLTNHVLTACFRSPHSVRPCSISCRVQECYRANIIQFISKNFSFVRRASEELKHDLDTGLRPRIWYVSVHFNISKLT